MVVTKTIPIVASLPKTREFDFGMQHQVAFLPCEPPRDSANTENQDQVERSKGNSSYKNVKSHLGYEGTN